MLDRVRAVLEGKRGNGGAEEVSLSAFRRSSVVFHRLVSKEVVAMVKLFTTGRIAADVKGLRDDVGGRARRCFAGVLERTRRKILRIKERSLSHCYEEKQWLEACRYMNK